MSIGTTKSSPVEGLTLQALITFLAPYTLPAPKLRLIRAMLTIGGGIEFFGLGTPKKEGISEGTCTYLLVRGSHRTLELGYMTPQRTLQETSTRTFFINPGHVPVTTLSVVYDLETTPLPQRGLLRRDETYRYWLDGRWVQLVSSTSTDVRLQDTLADAGEPLHIHLASRTFWPFVFGCYGDLERAEISAEHVGSLLGLNREKTLARHIGAGHLPVTRPTSHHPGITMAGFQEFLAYRQRFPQGHPRIDVVEAWQRDWRERYQHQTFS